MLTHTVHACRTTKHDSAVSLTDTQHTHSANVAHTVLHCMLLTHCGAIVKEYTVHIHVFYIPHMHVNDGPNTADMYLVLQMQYLCTCIYVCVCTTRPHLG